MALADFERNREPSSSRRGIRARHISPRHRPSVALRAVSAMLGIGAMAFAAALMISDRAPRALRHLFGDDVRRLWDRIDAGERTQFVNEAHVPDADFVIHVIVWAVILMLVATAIWTWRGLTTAVAGVFVCSVIIELAQGRYSDTRSVELIDIIANGAGVAIGTCAVAVIYLAWNGLASCGKARHQKGTGRLSGDAQ